MGSGADSMGASTRRTLVRCQSKESMDRLEPAHVDQDFRRAEVGGDSK